MSQAETIKVLSSIISSMYNSMWRAYIDEHITEHVSSMINDASTEETLNILCVLDQIPLVIDKKSRETTMLRELVELDDLFIESQDINLCKAIFNQFKSSLDIANIYDSMNFHEIDVDKCDQIILAKYELIKPERDRLSKLNDK